MGRQRGMHSGRINRIIYNSSQKGVEKFARIKGIEGTEENLYNSLNWNSIKLTVHDLYNQAEKRGWNKDKFYSVLYNNLMNKVASGSMFNFMNEPKLKENETDKNEGGLVYTIGKIFQKITTSKEQHGFEKSLEEANKIYQVLEEGGYLDINKNFAYNVQRANELPRLLKQMKEKNILSPRETKGYYQRGAERLIGETEKFKENLMNYSNYANYVKDNLKLKKTGKSLESLAGFEGDKDSLITKMGNSIRYAFGNIRDYITESGEYSKYAKIQASIFALVGFGMILVNLGITGAVISTNIKLTNNICGGVLLLIATFLFLFSRRNSKTFKR